MGVAFPLTQLLAAGTLGVCLAGLELSKLLESKGPRRAREAAVGPERPGLTSCSRKQKEKGNCCNTAVGAQRGKKRAPKR